MRIPKAAKGATARRGDALLKVEQLGGRLDLHAIKSDLQVQHLVRRFRLPLVRAELIARLAFQTIGGRA